MNSQEPRYTVDGEPTTVQDLRDEFEAEEPDTLAAILALAPGESVMFGGGAAALVELKREA